MKYQFLTLRLSIFHCVTLMIATAACLEAQTRPLPKPTKVRVVSIVIQPSAENPLPTVSGPQAYVDTTYVPPTGQTITVGVGGDFQAALGKAQPGDVITLAAGASYTGPFTLPVKSGTGYIVVRSSTADTSLPPVGTRITPAARNLMPRIVGPAGSPALVTAPGAHHFRFLPLEFPPPNRIYLEHLIQPGI